MKMCGGHVGQPLGGCRNAGRDFGKHSTVCDAAQVLLDDLPNNDTISPNDIAVYRDTKLSYDFAK